MSWVRNKLKAYAEQPACIEGDREWSYADLLHRMDAAADSLPSGERQVIEVGCATTAEDLATLLAIAETDHIALPLPRQIPAEARSSMRAAAADSPLYEKLEGSGLLLFSSGTTGQPKGMLHNFDSLLRRYERTRPRRDRSLLILMIDHIGGLDSAFRCLFAGSTLVVPEARTPESAAAAIARHRVNVLPASPTFLNLMLLAKVYEKYDLSSLSIIAYGAEAMPEPLLRRLGDAFPEAQRQQKFGTSETGSVRIKSVGDNSLFFRIADDDTQWKVIDSELWLRTPSRIIGYINAEQASLESEGWYRTGDLVESDDESNLRIIGRINETINVGGQKVQPFEVAQVLQSMPGIENVEVYGEDDPLTGQRVCARIVTSSPDKSTVWKRAIRTFCRGKLANWKVPSRVIVSDQLNVTSRLKRAGH